MVMSEKNSCSNCGVELTGRKGKKYCDNYCKSDFYYKKHKSEPDTLFKRVEKQIKLNRKFLAHFNTAGKSNIRKTKLIDEGFNPHFFTHYWKNKKGDVYFFCFDFGFLEVKERNLTKYILIEYQESYMGKVN